MKRRRYVPIGATTSDCPLAIPPDDAGSQHRDRELLEPAVGVAGLLQTLDLEQGMGP